MRPASRNRPRRLRSHLAPVALATLVAGLLGVPGVQAAAPASATLSAAPSPPPPNTGPTPRASADAKRMYAVTFTNMVVFENGAGYLHAFWRTLGTTGPDSPARLQWGRGCPDVSDRTFTALSTAFSQPDRFILIADRSPDPRQANAYCVTNVELERVQPPQDPSRPTTPPTISISPTAPSDPPPLLRK